MPVMPVPPESNPLFRWPHGLLPDVNVELLHDCLIKMEDPNNIPDNFNELPPEEQARLKGRYQYMGVRLRSDVKNQSVPIARETLEL